MLPQWRVDPLGSTTSGSWVKTLLRLSWCHAIQQLLCACLASVHEPNERCRDDTPVSFQQHLACSHGESSLLLSALRSGHFLGNVGSFETGTSGILFAVLGTLLVSGFPWFITFVLLCAYFVYSAKTEEKNMLQQFPKEYPEYRKRVKALIPFIW